MEGLECEIHQPVAGSAAGVSPGRGPLYSFQSWGIVPEANFGNFSAEEKRSWRAMGCRVVLLVPMVEQRKSVSSSSISSCPGNTGLGAPTAL